MIQSRNYFKNKKKYFKKDEKFNMSILKNELESIDELVNRQGDLADCKSRINCSKANLERDLRGQKCKILRGKMQDYCRYIPPEKDPNGNVPEIRTEAMERIEKRQKRKYLRITLNPFV